MPRISLFVAAAAAAALLTSCGGGSSSMPAAAPSLGLLGVAPDSHLPLYGTIESLERDGDRYLLRLDPTWFLTGVTANAAKAEDDGLDCEPTACPGVENDNYRLDEGRRVLTFLVPADARGTVLARTDEGYEPREVTADELADIVAGTSPLELYEPLSTGVWILVQGDTVKSFAQQYLP